MANIETDSETTLRISRTFAAPRARVYAAWTTPEMLLKWWRVMPTWGTPIADADLRVGGKYRLGMQDPDKPEPHVVVGTFREIKEAEKLVYTWSWEGSDAQETLVTVEFLDRDGGTEVMLTHERFPAAPVRDEHNKGWMGCLEQLDTVLAGS